MASLIWGSYARFVAKPVVAAVIVVSVLAINIGLILGSEMWNVPLATDIAKLWIDPASQVARNNKIVDEYSPKVDGTNNELVTLGNADGSNMLTSDSLQRWADYMSVIYDTVVVVNGTAFTLLDVCNGRLGQSPYVFGCSLTNPLDYFSEGGVFHPSEGTAQFLLDTKIAYFALADDSIAGRAVLWGWAINIDALSFGATDVYSTYFTKECLVSKRIFCGDNTVFLGQVNALLAAAAPTKLKMQLAWAKAQLAVTAMLIGASNITLLGNSTCAGSMFDAQTLNTTETETISFAGDTALLSMITPGGYVDGQKYSFANCSMFSPSLNIFMPCPGATCSVLALQSLQLFNFHSPCASCVMAAMYWLGDANRISKLNGPSFNHDVPPAGILSSGNPIPNFVIYNPTDNTSANAAATALITTAANTIKDTPGVCVETHNPTTAKTDIPASNCTYLWNQFVSGTVAGLTAQQHLAAHDAAGAQPFLDAAVTATTNRAALLAGLGRAEQELLKTGYTKDMIDAQWRKAIDNGALASVSVDADKLVRRHAYRPSFKNQNTTTLGQILSGFKNDLLTQNLKGAIFGSAVPPVSALHGGQCKCAPGFAGLDCSKKLDLICDCDTSLKSTCMTGLLGACMDYAPCATFPVITGLVKAAPSLNIPPEGLAAFQNFTEKMLISAAFAGTNSSIKASVVQNFVFSCLNYLPCVDTQNVATAPLSSFVPSNYANFFADASYNLLLALDIGAQTTNNPVYTLRTSLFGRACLGFYHANLDCGSAVNSEIESALGFEYNNATDVELLVNCTALDGGIVGNNCFGTATATLTLLAPLATNMDTVCPTAKAFASTIGSPVMTIGIYWMCYAESRHLGNGLASKTGRLSSLLWSKTSNSLPKIGACLQAPAASPGLGNCTLALSGLLMNAADTAMTGLSQNIPATTKESLQPVFSISTGSFPDFYQFGAASSVLSSSILNLPTINAVVDATAFGTCQNYSTTCPDTLHAIDLTLSGACNSSLKDYPVGAKVNGIDKSDCLAILGGLPGILSLNPAVKNATTLKMGELLARYKFAASVAGACTPTGGVASGGGDCWVDSDCSSAKAQGSCDKLSDASYLTYVKKFAGVIFSNSPEGTQKTLLAIESRWRGVANKPIIDRYNARNPGRRLAVEVGVANSVNLTVDQAEEVLHNWRLAVVDNIDTYRKALAGSTTPDVVTADSPTNLLDEISQADPRILILGYGLMLLYAFLACTNWSTDIPATLNGSRALVSQAGIMLVAISVASGLGVSHLLHVEWSAAATQIVPFVMLGLGVSDVFIMIRTFPMYQDGMTAADAAAKGLATSGPSMLLVTVTNAGVFAVGVLTAMPVVVNFALQAVIVCIANYLTVNTVLPALLILDYHRQAKGKMDLLPCVTVGTSARAQVTHDGEYEQNVFNRLCVPHYTRCILSIPGKIFIFALSTAFIASAIYGEEVVAELGLQLSDIAPVGTDLSNALITRDESFAFYTMSIVSDLADWSHREVQQGIIKVFDDVMSTSKVVPASGTPWMKAFMAWGLPKTPSYDPTATGGICDPNFAQTNGKCGLLANCTVITGDPSVVLENKIPFYNSTDFYRCLNNWINSDLAYDALRPGFPLEDENAPRGFRVLKLVTDSNGQYLPFSRGTVITRNLQYNNDFVVLINEVRAVANANTVPPTFPIGEPIDFWDQYVNLRSIINTAVGYGLLICFVSIFILLLGLSEGEGSGLIRRFVAVFWAAALTTGVIAMTVYEIYGYMAFSGVKISAIPAISIIMCTGVAVEYTAYITVQFVNAAGDRNQRSRHALMVMMAPTIDGAVTMFLGVVMLAASPFLFIVKYFFVPWLFIIGFGFFNGIAVIPVLFSLIGPIAINLKNKTDAGGETSKELAANKV